MSATNNMRRRITNRRGVSRSSIRDNHQLQRLGIPPIFRSRAHSTGLSPEPPRIKRRGWK